MQLGIDQLTDGLAHYAAETRVGVVCHAASVDSRGRHITTYFTDRQPGQLAALFGPEHGITTTAQDMEHVSTHADQTTGVPIYSLYGDSPASLRPTAAMLHGLDLLVIDLQDIGTRYYTYIYTMAFCLEACAAAQIPVVVCDRPNPINGVSVEGPLVQPGFDSFVGHYPLPVRHGMTIGELAMHFNKAYHLGAAVTILPLRDWDRASYWESTGLSWRHPSPNMRSVAAALLYPGMCLLEGTNISEGRGTETPFELCGAPWIDGEILANKLRHLRLAGIDYTPVQFTPTSRKFAGQQCGGVRLHVTDRDAFRAYEFGLALLWTLSTLHVATENPREFGWRTPHGNPPHTGLDAGPYEFVIDRPAIDLLTGHDTVRQGINRETPWLLLKRAAGPTPPAFLDVRRAALLYS
ncbi:MAG: DUF1343 domain-containing protein [Deltaproteobacteria bacterium]|nr:DUF1343 domain-containing protein [Deltaproteobacteria bacterium]